MRDIRIAFFLSLLLFDFALQANEKIDSLKTVLMQQSEEDATRVEILNALGYEYWVVNPVQSIIYGQQARVLASVIEDKNGLAFANRVIGVAHWARGSYDDGLKYLSESLTGYQSIGDSLGQGNCMMNIGLIYSDRSDNDRALSFYFEALKIFEGVKAEDRAATTYTKIATIFIDQNKLDASRDFLDRALKIHQANEFRYGVAEVYNRFGSLKIEDQTYDSAIFYLENSLAISNEINDIEGKTKTLVDLAEVWIKRKEFSKAEVNLEDALVIAREIGSYKWLKEIYDGLQLISRTKGDLKQALLYFDQYVQVKDSIFNEQTINNISRLEAELATTEQKRQLDSREQQIVILEQEAALQKAKMAMLIVFAIAIFVVSYLVLRVRKKNAKIREEKALKEASAAKQQLEFKNRELMSYTVNFVQKNQLFEELISTIQGIKKAPSENIKKDLVGIERVVKRHLQVDRDWEDFKLRFENLHSGFFEKLLEKTPSLTNNDLKLSVLVKMNFSIKEIADMMGISSESVKTSRYRLKKKLKLPQEQNLNDFLNRLA